jgi:alpha-tubulin suppressor-like RCC1 family protein
VLFKNFLAFSTCNDTLVCTMVDGSLLVYSVVDSDVPIAIERYTTDSKVLKTFSGGSDMIIVLLADGSIMVRGNNIYNQLQVSTDSIAEKYIKTWTRGFEQYSSLKLKMVEFGSQHIVCLDTSGKANGYGFNNDAQLTIFNDGPIEGTQKVQCKFLSMYNPKVEIF